MAIIRLATTEVQVDGIIYTFDTPVSADAFEACCATVDVAHCETDHPPLSKRAVGQVSKILFTGEPTPAEDGGVDFRALVDGNPVNCHVGADALEQHFGSREQIRPVDAYERGKGRIHAVAEKMLRAQPTERAVIRAEDIGQA